MLSTLVSLVFSFQSQGSKEEKEKKKEKKKEERDRWCVCGGGGGGGGGVSTGKNAVVGQCLLARTLLVDQFRRQRNERVVNKINRRGGRKRNSSSKTQIEMGGWGEEGSRAMVEITPLFRN